MFQRFYDIVTLAGFPAKFYRRQEVYVSKTEPLCQSILTSKALLRKRY